MLAANKHTKFFKITNHGVWCLTNTLEQRCLLGVVKIVVTGGGRFSALFTEVGGPMGTLTGATDCLTCEILRIKG